MIKAKDEVEEVLGQPDIPLSAAQRLTERRTLLALGVAECAFRSRRRPGGVGRDPPPDCGVLWKMAQLGKRARATPPPGCGGVAPVNDLCSWPKGCLRRFAGMPMGSMQGYINWCVHPFRVNKAGDGWPKAPTFPKTHDVAGGS